MRRHICLVVSLVAWSGIARALPFCQIKSDQWAEKNPFTACFATEWQGFGVLDSNADKRARHEGIAGEAYGSVALGHWMSLHLKGSVKNAPEPDFPEQVWIRSTDNAFLQLGHPLVDSIYVATGRIDAPFGLDHDLYRLQLPSRAEDLWHHRVQGSRGSFRWQDDLLFEIGAHQEDIAEDDVEQSQRLSGRLVQNIDLLNGTKLIGSYLSTTDYGEREIGMATLVQTDNNRTSLEWVRKTVLTDRRNFRQIFRFVHEQEHKDYFWNFVFEEIRRDSYRISYGIRKPWTPMLSGTASLHYQRETRDNPHKHLLLLLGLNYRCAFSWEENTL